MRTCACGCGGTVISTDKRTRYIPNHHLAKARAARSENQKAISLTALANTSGLCECGCGMAAPLAVITRRSAGWVEGQPVRFISGHNAPRFTGRHTEETKAIIRTKRALQQNISGTIPHYQSRTRTYKSWSSMRSRCRYEGNASFPYYGGRGITVCARWNEPHGIGFRNFLADMGERPEGKTLDRIDNNGNYTPDNCRWATPKEQAANR